MSEHGTIMHSSPSLDMVDAMFLRRLKSMPSKEGRRASPETSTRPPAFRPEETAPPDAHIPTPEVPMPELAAVAASPSPTATGKKAPDSQPLVAWLLEQAPEQWSALAATVERAVAEGLRVIAVAGGGRGEGRTTLVEALGVTLTARGWHVVRIAGPLSSAAGNTFSRAGNDREVVIVDAGVWFPPGPIRHDRVAAMSVGCDAVILVRRATQAPSPARAAAIEQTGCRLLGEVETLVPMDTFEDLAHHADT
jgi:hypothetical protein